MSERYKNSGFSLVSMAVILVVAGLIIGSLTSLVSRRVRTDLAHEAKRSLRQARAEAVGFTADRCALLSANATEPDYFLNHVGHRLGRFRESTRYEPAPKLTGLTGPDLANYTGDTGLSLVIPGTGVVNNLAFLLWTEGENHEDDFGKTRQQTGLNVSYTLAPYIEGQNDDMVDYVAFPQLKSRITGCQ